MDIEEDMPDWLLDLVFRGMHSPTERDRQLRADLQTVIRHRRFNADDGSNLTEQFCIVCDYNSTYTYRYYLGRSRR
jgi:hypothetical protein